MAQLEVVYFILGLVILLLVTIDIFWTTLWVDGGAGPVSDKLATYTWKSLKKIGGNHPKLLSLAGPLILALTLLSWVLLLWLGWLLLFSGDSNSIVDTRDNMPIEWIERIYFTGFTVFTLGTGDYVPKTGFWQLATAIAAGNGMLFITLGVTYVLSVLGAVTQQRAFASSITGLGKSGSLFIRKAWNGKDFHNMDLVLSSLSAELGMLTSQHKAYPVLHFYHSTEAAKSASVGVTILDEGLTLLACGIPEEYQPNQMLLDETRSSIDDYLEAIPPDINKSASQVPAAPDLIGIQQYGLPTVPLDAFYEEVKKLEDRRSVLLALVKMDTRPWPDGDI